MKTRGPRPGRLVAGVHRGQDGVAHDGERLAPTVRRTSGRSTGSTMAAVWVSRNSLFVAGWIGSDRYAGPQARPSLHCPLGTTTLTTTVQGVGRRDLGERSAPAGRKAVRRAALRELSATEPPRDQRADLGDPREVAVDVHHAEVVEERRFGDQEIWDRRAVPHPVVVRQGLLQAQRPVEQVGRGGDGPDAGRAGTT